MPDALQQLQEAKALLDGIEPLWFDRVDMNPADIAVLQDIVGKNPDIRSLDTFSIMIVPNEQVPRGCTVQRRRLEVVGVNFKKLFSGMPDVFRITAPSIEPSSGHPRSGFGW